MKLQGLKYNVLMCILLTLIMVGCSGDDSINGGNGDYDVNGNILTLRITMAAPYGMTRATSQNPTGGEDGDGWRAGSYNENNINTVYLYKYSSADGINANDDTPVTLLASNKQVGFKPTSADIKTDGSIEKEIEFNVGAYTYNASNNDHFIAVINTTMPEVTTTLGALRNSMFISTWTQNGSQMKDCDNFAMSNAEDSRFVGGAGTKTSPYIVEIPVERMAARIDFAYSQSDKSAGKFGIEGDAYAYKVIDMNDKVYLTHVRITNGMQPSSYLIKRLAKNESATPSYLAKEKKPAEEYVVDPFTWDKTILNVESGNLRLDWWFGDSKYATATKNYNSATTPWFRDFDKVHTGTGDAFTNGTTFDEKESDWHYYVMGYVNENTMKAEQTLHYFTTGLVLKATYVPETVYGEYNTETKALTSNPSYTKGSTLWRWHDVDTNEDLYFSNKEAAEAYESEHPNSVVFEYKDAICYYNVWIRHENIVDDPTTTMMEFAIVRNNIYRICVEFTGIGMPDVPDTMITPETIRMFIYVRKWNLINHPTIEL